MADTIKDTLLKNGFTYMGMCQTCGGRAYDYQLDGIKAKVKVDANMNELIVIFNGLTPDRRRIYNEAAIPATIELKLTELNLNGNNTGN